MFPEVVEVPGKPNTPQEKGQILLNTAAARVWSEILASKKDVITDTFKVRVDRLLYFTH